MQSRSFPALHTTVSEIGLGAWQLGGDCWGQIDDAQAEAILQAAVGAGITLFDTADVYGDGLSERRIGKFLRETKPNVRIATKVGRAGVLGGGPNCTREAVRAHVLASRERLGVEAIDLIQLHCVPTAVLGEGTIFEWLRELQQEGVVRSWGASVESVEEGLLCLTQPGCASLQVIFNVLRPRPGDLLIPRAQQLGVAILVRLPLASGLLSGRYTKETTFPAGDHRTFNRDGQGFHVGETFNGIPFEIGVDAVDHLKADLTNGMSMADAALRWILDHPGVTTVIPGATRPDQVVRNATAPNLAPLPAGLHQTWRAFFDAHVAAHVRGQQ